MINNQQNNQTKNVTLPLLTDRRMNISSNNNNNNNSNNNNIINENLNNINKIEDETKNYIDDLKKGSYNILVVVRCRPLSILESQISSYETIRIMDKKMVVLMDPIEYNGPNSVFKNRSREITYAFDFAFDKYSTQKEIYDHSTKFLLDGVVNGYNATVFAYGATGAGKTYTMTGTDNNPGIMPLTLTELFNKVNSYTDREYKLTMSYLEIYNENIRDLLKFANPNYNNNNLNNTNDEYLDLREDPNKGIIVSNITELNVSSCKDILNILKRGNRNRTQEATGANETSSRSHAVLQVSIEYKEKTTGIDVEIKFSKLSLIDLAGSERASATQNRGIRLIEGANINRSLLTLGNCINALCDAASKGIKKPYVPYRDSKLTRLLKDSLGGNARTIMIANISPSINTFDDTNNTLKYANRAKNIKTFVQRNVLNAQYHISNYVNIINNLKKELSELKEKMANGNNNIMSNGILNNQINNNNKNVNNIINDNLNNQNINNNNNNEIFEKILSEIKILCDKQIKTKEKIIKNYYEISKIKELMEMNNSITNVNNEISTVLNKTDINEIDNNNQTNTNNAQIQSYQDRIDLITKSKDLSENHLKQYESEIDKLLINSIKNGKLFQNQIDYLKLIVSNAQEKIKLIEEKFQSSIKKANYELKEELIKELQKQINYRDEYFLENNINIFTNPKFKTTEEIKSEFQKKNPKFILYKEYNGQTIQTYTSGKKKLPSLYPKNQSFSISNNNILNYNNKRLANFNNNNINNNFIRKGSPKNNKNIIRNYSNVGFDNCVPSSTPKLKKYNRNNSISNKLNNYNINNNKYDVFNYYIKKKQKRISNSGSKHKRNIKSVKNNKLNLNSSRNNSFNMDSSFNNGLLVINNRKKSNGSQLLTQEQNFQIKKNELNQVLNERDRKRQKFLDKINGVNEKDML